MKKKLNKQQQMRSDRTINEGERIYQMMATAMLSASKTISGTVAMNYALSKLIANYHLAMLLMDINVEDYMNDMVKEWEGMIGRGAETESQQPFDDLIFKIQINMDSHGERS